MKHKKKKIKFLKKIVRKVQGVASTYIRGFNILYEYFDSIPEEERTKVSKELNDLGL